MATIEQRKTHTLGVEKAREKAEELANGMQKNIGIEWAWKEHVINFEAKSGKAKGTKGTVEVSATEVVIKMDLPFLLRPLKGMIESKVKEKLDEIVT